MRLVARSALLALTVTVCLAWARPPAAVALNPLGPVCGAAGLVSGLAGKVCGVLKHGGRALKAGQKLLGGHVGGAVNTLTGGGGGRAPVSTAIELAAIGAWAVGGAKVALRETAKVIGETTSPQLETTWFSATYWRMAGIGALLTLPFLFAAAVQALMQADLSLLARAALGYLPLSLIAVGIAAPLTMLLLSASDQLSAIVSAAAGNAGARFLGSASGLAGAFGLIIGSPFLVFLIAFLTSAAALVLWVELLMRAAAVYVVVLMLPLAFAALVWPARRVWAVRAVELLMALILSKFAIVAVLSLGGAALSESVGGHSIAGALAGFVVLTLGAFAPWVMLRLLPLAELASGAVSSLRGEVRRQETELIRASGRSAGAENWAQGATAQMRRELEESPDQQPQRVEQPPAPRHEVATANGASTANPAAPATPASAAATDAPTERIPGLRRIWQQPDGEWPTLDFSDGLPPDLDDHDPTPPPQT